MEDFYRKESSGLYLHRIGVPVFMMNARDDPMFFPETEEFVSRSAERNPHLLLIVTEWGGHNGWDRRLWPSMKPQHYQSLMEHAAEKILLAVYTCMCQTETVDRKE